MKKIIHDRKNCIGCGSCASMCSQLFEMNKEDGLADLKNSEIVGDHFELVIEDVACGADAAMICPVKVIRVEEISE